MIDGESVYGGEGEGIGTAGVGVGYGEGDADGIEESHEAAGTGLTDEWWRDECRGGDTEPDEE